jgi:hypothetical protein
MGKSPSKPQPGEYGPFYQGYVNLVGDDDLLPLLERQPAELVVALTAVDESRAGFRYQPEKWSIREVVGHLGDAERVFGYRALCFSRGDKAELPGFDENSYVASSTFDSRPLSELLESFEVLRRANLFMLRALREEDWTRSGVANRHSITVRALGYVMAGHVRHHLNILQQRYLKP